MKNIYEVNKNIVISLINGSSISLPQVSENISSIVEAWYPGLIWWFSYSEAFWRF